MFKKLQKCQDVVIDDVQEQLSNFKSDLKKFNKTYFVESESDVDEFADVDRDEFDEDGKT